MLLRSTNCYTQKSNREFRCPRINFWLERFKKRVHQLRCNCCAYSLKLFGASLLS